MLKQILKQDPNVPLGIIPVFSRGGSGALYARTRDPLYGTTYCYPLAIGTHEDSPGLATLEREDVRALSLPRGSDVGLAEWSSELIKLLEKELQQTNYDVSNIVILS
ncbi:MAG: hypothetical protein IH899_19495, partial [Planctomycetes bacterium]|nr:hypothetical protein [Planctomycetota bacterium]